MSSVSAVNTAATTAASSATSSSTTTTSTKKTLGQDDFLKLLAQQFQSQDPMKPVDDTAYLAQLAQFTSLEQTNSISTSLTEMKTQQALTTANSYIGHNVTINDGSDTNVTGSVSGVEIQDGTPRLVVGGNTYAVSSVIKVESGSTSQTTTTGQ